MDNLNIEKIRLQEFNLELYLKKMNNKVFYNCNQFKEEFIEVINFYYFSEHYSNVKKVIRLLQNDEIKEVKINFLDLYFDLNKFKFIDENKEEIVLKKFSIEKIILLFVLFNKSLINLYNKYHTKENAKFKEILLNINTIVN